MLEKGACLDAAYHQYRALKNADAERLADMGISRKAADRAFYRQFADKKIDCSRYR